MECKFQKQPKEAEGGNPRGNQKIRRKFGLFQHWFELENNFEGRSTCHLPNGRKKLNSKEQAKLAKIGGWKHQLFSPVSRCEEEEEFDF